MTTAADAVRAFVEPLLDGWRLQFGRWVDDGGASRYAVLRPVPGAMAGLVREPRFTLLLIAAATDDATHAHNTASALVEQMRGGVTPPTGLVSIRAGEPAASVTNDGRATAEFSINTIID